MNRAWLCTSRKCQRAGVIEIAFENSRSVLRERTGVAGTSEVQRARCGHGINCLGDDSVLKWGLVKVGNIVDDDVAVIWRVSQRLNVSGKARLPSIRCREKQLGLWHEVMNYLDHRPAFIRACATRVLHDCPRRCIAQSVARPGRDPV